MFKDFQFHPCGMYWTRLVCTVTQEDVAIVVGDFNAIRMQVSVLILKKPVSTRDIIQQLLFDFSSHFI